MNKQLHKFRRSIKFDTLYLHSSATFVFASECQAGIFKLHYHTRIHLHKAESVSNQRTYLRRHQIMWTYKGCRKKQTDKMMRILYLISMSVSLINEARTAISKEIHTPSGQEDISYELIMKSKHTLLYTENTIYLQIFTVDGGKNLKN